jgi:protein-tyrosine phosphatase
LGVTLVINMRIERRPYPDSHNPPMDRLWLPTIDHPLFPIPIKALRRGSRAALETIEQGGKVFVHCAAGVHRSVAQAAAILIAQGRPLSEAMTLIKAQRPVADPEVWYIRRRIEKFNRSWDGKP